MTRSFDPNSLIPENPILVYPSLAATIGLEEATMLSLLTGYARQQQGLGSNGFTWYLLHEAVAAQLMPFWQPADIQRVATNLREQGLLLIASAPYLTARQLKFAFNEKMARPAAAPAITTAPTQSKNLIAPSWQPDRETLGRLAQHNIPSSFALEQVPEFVNYWRERGENAHSWGSKFIQHTIRKWREFESQTAMRRNWRPSQDTVDVLTHQKGISREFIEDAVPEFIRYWSERGEPAHSWDSVFMQHAARKWREYEAEQNARNREVPMTHNWRPSAEAMDLLTRHSGISQQFIEDAIPEFELYWREKGIRSDNWNKKFRDHVHHQWLRYKAALEHDPTPRRLPPNWLPSEDVYEVLRLANIEVSFAQSLLPEFVIYWRDSNQVHSSWNTRFLQYVKQRWAKRLTNDPQTKSTRDLSLAEQLTDRSWAL